MGEGWKEGGILNSATVHTVGEGWREGGILNRATVLKARPHYAKMESISSPTESSELKRFKPLANCVRTTYQTRAVPTLI